MRLNDKVIIVTGSTTGIGKGIAKRCVAEGARVLIHGLEKDWADELLQELGEDKAAVCICDLADEASYSLLVHAALSRFGRIDAIVNNAAKVASSDIHSTDHAYLSNMFSINTAAPLMLIREALAELAKNEGAVLNIGSVNAYSGEPNLLAYSMSKGALMTMTRNLGDTLFRSYGIRVNQVNPGWVLTENESARKRMHGLADDWYKDLPDVYAPAGRLLTPDEIAAAVIYWLSDESGPVSGQVVDLEQYPFIGRNPPKDSSTIPKK
jgi:NAD(P)-dependent dehydrogenase (short-subunit alcohol dehydrogenase family)